MAACHPQAQGVLGSLGAGGLAQPSAVQEEGQWQQR